MAGKLIFRYGAMGCGKTSHLLQTAHNFEEQDKKVVVTKPDTDTKNGTKLLTRIGLERETNFIFTKHCNLDNYLTQRFLWADAFFIDEAQFLTPKQVDQLLRFAIREDVLVFCYGLRLNFRLQDSGFEGATRLLQLAHELTELKTMCSCGKKAVFNARFENDKMVIDGPNVLIDGTTTAKYRALCAECYYKHLDKLSICPTCGQPVKNCGKH